MSAAEKRNVQIGPGCMLLASFERQDWVANVPQDCTIEDIKRPDFWSLMAARLKPYDRIEVRADDGTWLAEVIVIGCDRTWAKVNVLNTYKLTGVEEAAKETGSLEFKFKGPGKKWCIIRKSDGEILREGIQTKDEVFRVYQDLEASIG